MAREQHRHDISDRAWEKIRPYTIGEKGTRGGNARDTRQFINGVFWILRTGAPWRDLPETYGNWKNVHRRFCRWRDKGIWEKILEALARHCCALRQKCRFLRRCCPNSLYCHLAPRLLTTPSNKITAIFELTRRISWGPLVRCLPSYQ